MYYGGKGSRLDVGVQSLVTVDGVDIRYNGAQRNSFFGRSALYTSIVHEGTPFVRARNCTDYQFVHDRTVVLHSYDVYSGKTTQPATLNRGDACPMPLLALLLGAQWRIRI